jgi:small conductance mechanosensitive channel
MKSSMDNKTELLAKIQVWTANFGIKAISAVMLVLIGIQLARFLQAVVGKSIQKARIDATLVLFASNLVYITVVAMTVIVALGQLGVQTASFIAILGSIGVAVGLALQGSLSNFAAGILIIVLRPFKVDDYIECLGIGGTVKKIHPLNTTLITPDNRTIVAPNRKLFDDCLTNHSSQPQRRIDFIFGTKYENDIDSRKREATPTSQANHLGCVGKRSTNSQRAEDTSWCFGLGKSRHSLCGSPLGENCRL